MEMARRAGLVRLGHVAIDSTRVQANASRQRVVDGGAGGRQQRARDRRQVRRFQQRAMAPDPDEGAGVELAVVQPEVLEQQLAAAGQGLEEVAQGETRRQVSADRSGQPVFAHSRRLGAGLHGGYGGERRPLHRGRAGDAERDRQCFVVADGGRGGEALSATSCEGDGGLGIFQRQRRLRECSRRGIDLYVPDNNLRHEMTSGRPAGGIGRQRHSRSGTFAAAGEVAQPSRTEDVSTTASGSGTSVWGAERTARDATISASWSGGGQHGMDVGRHRPQHRSPASTLRTSIADSCHHQRIEPQTMRHRCTTRAMTQTPTGLASNFPLDPALRLRLRAGLRLFRACGTGFGDSYSTAMGPDRVS